MKKTALVFLIGLCFLALPVSAQINLLHEFAGTTTDGAYPQGDLIISGTTLFGMTPHGGSNDKGTIFKIQIDGNDYTLLHEFTGGAGDGSEPSTSLILSGTTLYGMTERGGASDNGIIFKIEANGSGFSSLHEFSGDDGRAPVGSLILSESILYGMTAAGGERDMGTIFGIQTDGTNFSILHEFAGGADDGLNPYGSLLISDSTLFGMTCFGGDSDWGTIFKIQNNGTDFSLLHEFTSGNNDGASPYGSLMIADSALYGMTRGGGDENSGTIFKIQNDGSVYTLLHEFSFSPDDGENPQGSLVLSGSTLYGMTNYGGDSLGTIFKIETNGALFSLLHVFLGGEDNGAIPEGSLIFSNSTLYGMTRYGGDSGLGVIFSLPLYIISGTVTHEGFPLANVVMDGLPGNPVTNGSGYYSATVAAGWSGTVTPTRRYYDFSPSSASYTGIDSDQTTDYTATLIQPLVVTAPAVSSQWEKGRTYQITWLKQGAQDANVKIALCKDTSTLVQMIATTTPNDGAYDWTVPATLAVGSNYFIRVRTVDNLLSDFSDKFSIIVPAITVTSPTSGAVWVRNTTKTITWTRTGTQDANVRIQLFKDGVKKLDITPGAPNSGSYDWAIPATLANGLYTIRVTTLDGKVKGASKSFSIARGMIRVTEPAAGALWQRGVAHAIAWSGEGSLNASVRIQLFKGTTLVKTISATTANDGGFDWTIPANQALATKYRILVVTVDGKVTGQSGLFAITGGPG